MNINISYLDDFRRNESLSISIRSPQISNTNFKEQSLGLKLNLQTIKKKPMRLFRKTRSLSKSGFRGVNTFIDNADSSISAYDNESENPPTTRSILTQLEPSGIQNAKEQYNLEKLLLKDNSLTPKKLNKSIVKEASSTGNRPRTCKHSESMKLFFGTYESFTMDEIPKKRSSNEDKEVKKQFYKL